MTIRWVARSKLLLVELDDSLFIEKKISDVPSLRLSMFILLLTMYVLRQHFYLIENPRCRKHTAVRKRTSSASWIADHIRTLFLVFIETSLPVLLMNRVEWSYRQNFHSWFSLAQCSSSSTPNSRNSLLQCLLWWLFVHPTLLSSILWLRRL